MSDKATVVTVAGGYDGCHFRDGAGTDAAFRYPLSVCCNGRELLVGDRHNHRVRAVQYAHASAALVRTVAGTGDEGLLNRPSGVAVDPRDGSVLVADCWNHAVKRVREGGAVEVVAGTGEKGYLDGPAASAQFRFPMAVAVNRRGDILVADQHNHAIRKISPDGVVSTLAGCGEEGYKDGPASSARFHWPSGLAYDAVDGSLYVADTANHVVRRVSEEGVVSTYAGAGRKGYKDAMGREAQFNEPRDVALTPQREVVVADEGGHYIRRISRTRVVSTVAGTGEKGFADGAAPLAVLSGPSGVDVDVFGGIVFADCWNSRIRRIEEPGLGQCVRVLCCFDASTPITALLSAAHGVRNRIDATPATRDVKERALGMGVVDGAVRAIERNTAEAELLSACTAILNILSFSLSDGDLLRDMLAAVPAVLTAMRRHLMCARLEAACASLLWNVCADGSAAAAAVAEAGGGSALVLALKALFRETRLVEKASGALFYLSKLSQTLEELSDTATVDVLASSLALHAAASPVTVQNVLALLWNIAKHNSPGVVDQIDSIVVAIEAAAMDRLSLQKACGLLNVLLSDAKGKEVATIIAGSSVVSVLADSLVDHSGDAVCAELCAQVFQRLLNLGQPTALAERRCVEAALLCLEQHPRNARVQGAVWLVLRSIVASSREAAQMMQRFVLDLEAVDRLRSALTSAAAESFAGDLPDLDVLRSLLASM